MPLLQARVGVTFSLDFTGERMNTENAQAQANAHGPRMKIIELGGTCSTAALAWNITGLECTKPAGAAQVSGPAFSWLQWLGRLRKLRIS